MFLQHVSFLLLSECISLPVSVVVASALRNFLERRFYLSSRNYKRIYIQETSVGAHVSFMHANWNMS